MIRRYLHITFILAMLSGGCVSLNGGPDAERLDPAQASELSAAHAMLKEKRFGDAIEAYRTLIREHPGSSAAAAAQYSIGLAMVLPENSHKDYAQASLEFEEFIVRYPGDRRIDEARGWRALIKLAIDSKRENERLQKNIEQLKKLDVQQEEKRHRK